MKHLSLTICLLTLAAVCLESAAAMADGDVAINFLHMCNQLATPPGTIADLAADENSEPQSQSRFYEISGKVVGQISGQEEPVLLLQSGQYSVEIAAPTAFLSNADWMGPGSVVRALVKSTQDLSADDSAPVLNLIVAAPEDSVSFAEKKLALDEAKIEASAKARLQSRSMSAETSRSAALSSRFVPSTTPVAGLSSRAAAIYPAYYSAIAHLNPNLSADDVATITRSILYYSDAYQLDPRLVIAMVVAESGFDPDCVSSTGATGLGQLMPETAAGLGVTDAFDPEQNIAGAVRLLSDHVQRYGGAAPCGVVPINTLMLTMAAYNAGPGAVKKYGGIPPYRETQNYVRRVNQLYRQLCGS